MKVEADQARRFVFCPGWIGADHLIERGVREGMAGAQPTSEHPAYFDGWQRGERALRAGRSELVVTYMAASRCECCGAEAPGYLVVCPGRCQNVDVLYGHFCLHGPRDLNDELTFISNIELRILALQGMPIVNSEGDSITEQILIQ